MAGTLRARWHLLLPAVATAIVLYGGRGAVVDAPDLSGDSAFHLGSVREMSDVIRDGRNPFASMPQTFGIPILRFYQPLTYLFVGTASAVTGAPSDVLLRWFVLLCFAASPWSYYAMMRWLGAERAAAGVTALLSVASVSAFSHSFGAYYQLGIVTQAFGAIFFPLFVGRFARLLREGVGAVPTAVYCALASLSHATLMVYAALVGLVLVFTFTERVRTAALGLMRFAVVEVALVAFWVFPFLLYYRVYRPISDVVTRPNYAMWFVGLSPRELATLLGTGRLLDGPRGLDDVADKLLLQLNGSFPMAARPPYLTVLLLVGLLVALVQLRRPLERFLVSGLAVSLLVLLGSDDVPLPWGRALLYLAQPFRVTYLVDLFVVALAGIGVCGVGAWLYRRCGAAPGAAARGLRGGLAAVAVALVAAHTVLTVSFGEMLAGPSNWGPVPAAEDALDQVRRAGLAPGRWSVQFGKRKTEGMKNYLLALGYTTHEHMCGLGPLTTFHLCRRILRKVEVEHDLATLSGVRYVLTDRRAGKALGESKRPDGSDRFRRIVRRRLEVWESTDRDMVHAPAGARVLVVVNDVQWVWLAEAWMRRHTKDALTAPMPARVAPGDLAHALATGAFDAALVADPDVGKTERTALGTFVRRGGAVLAPTRIAGVPTTTLDRTLASWEDALPAPHERPRPKVARTVRARLGGPYELATDYDRPTLIVLAEHHYPAWQARTNGRAVATLAVGPDLVGAVVPAGRQRIAFEYRLPPLEVWTLVASALAWLLVAVLGVWNLARSLRRSTEAHASETRSAA